MRTVVLTYGTRGDVQPFVALGVGLQRAGHSVCLAAPESFEALVAGRGLEFVPLPGDPAQLARTLVDGAGLNPFLTTRAMAAHTFPLGARVIGAVLAACRGAQAIVHSFLFAGGGHAVARMLGVPDFSAQTFPVFASTGAFPALMAPALPMGPAYNRLTHALSTQLFWRANQLGYLWVRREYPELPRRLHWPFASTNRVRTPVLFGFSPTIVPRPGDWPEHVHVTGYWFLDADRGWQPPHELVRFLDSGPPPVCIGFGSMVTDEARRLRDMALSVLAQTGLRGILLGDWGQPAPTYLPEDVLALATAPHDWLFPRCSAVVHHGGAGTTAAGIRAGVPAVVVPFTADQPFWGMRAYELGVSPRPIPRRRLAADRLAAALREVTSDRTMRERTRALGQRISAEVGVARAIEVIHRHTEDTAEEDRH